MPDNNNSLAKALKAEAVRLGFATCGITQAGHDFGERLSDWLADGCHGDMGWMEVRAEQRRGPTALWPDARSVIMLGMSYVPAQDPRRLAEARSRGRISVYAQGQDYHDVVKKALKALARWLVERTGCELKVFVDTAPVMEKPLGQQAGVGWQGKHSNLVSRSHGSWLFLGAIMTTLDLLEDAPEADHCGRCTACQTACPTNAFPAPYRVDARRCISYLTIEHAGPIPEEFRVAMGNRIYGCDDCLAACPWNKFAQAAQAHRAFLPRAELAAPSLGDLLALDDPGFRRIFSGSPIKRIGRNRMVRNAAIAAGNSGDAALLPALMRLTDDDDAAVADAARWAVARLSPG
jgi:epoxyqueuosine reductase